ncbi:hypothetical protein NQZ68_037092 [Dissostichus eleginoides]|nr:hypothetical protein NQZ68_037092 [Dissostichus eleginoides]
MLISSPKTVTLRAPVAVFTPSAETSDDETESHHKLDTTSVDGDGGEREESKEGGENRESSPSNCASPGSLSGQGKAKAASGLVESLKLMSLCLSSQFHNLTGGGGGGAGRRGCCCCWGHTGPPNGEPVPPAARAGGPAGDPLLDGPHSGTLRLGELDLARENHRNMKNRVLQRPLSDKTLSVNIHRGPKEGLLCTPTPHSCCQGNGGSFWQTVSKTQSTDTPLTAADRLSASGIASPGKGYISDWKRVDFLMCPP